jgi:hypothetical protein
MLPPMRPRPIIPSCIARVPVTVERFPIVGRISNPSVWAERIGNHPTKRSSPIPALAAATALHDAALGQQHHRRRAEEEPVSILRGSFATLDQRPGRPGATGRCRVSSCVVADEGACLRPDGSPAAAPLPPRSASRTRLRTVQYLDGKPAARPSRSTIFSAVTRITCRSDAAATMRLAPGRHPSPSRGSWCRARLRRRRPR